MGDGGGCGWGGGGGGPGIGGQVVALWRESSENAFVLTIPQAGPIALRLAKKAINCGLEVDVNTGLRLEEALYAQV